MSLPGDDWKVEKHGQACCGCETEFEEGEAFFSALREEEGAFQRQDFCDDCWEGEGADGFFCFWRSRRAESDGQQTVGPAVLLDLLDQMRNPSSRREKALRFVLALYLSRKKALRLSGEHENGTDLLFEVVGGDEQYRVEPVELEDEEQDKLTRRLREMLAIEG
ncbi:MAG: hypothetical protein V5A84_00675 [Planctomycetota bacterium]